MAKLNVYKTEDIIGNPVAIGTVGLSSILEEGKDEIIFASAGHRSLTQLVELAQQYDEMIANDVAEMEANGVVDAEFEVLKDAEEEEKEESDDGTPQD